MNNWRIEQDGKVYLKVIEFPVPEESGVGGESMWVRKVSGTDDKGTGVLDNNPAFCTAVSYGDTIQYAGGTKTTKPKYIGKVEVV